jgi:osmoprotectant transport system ATP-binding protein
MTIILENASKHYPDKIGLHPTSLTIEDGQTTVLIGPSGCGKSTILRLIVGLIQPTSGAIFYNDKKITPETIYAIRKDIGYVIQDGGLFPHLTVEENLSLINQSKTRIDDLCDLISFDPRLLKRYPLQLSGGERQRVGIMRALMLDPSTILLDEPLAALDPIIRFDLQQQLRHVFKELKKTVILVTHDMREAAYLGQKIVLMRDGKIIQQGSFRELHEHPAEAYVKHFIESQQYQEILQ